jgi:hypothetical protein
MYIICGLKIVAMVLVNASIGCQDENHYSEAIQAYIAVDVIVNGISICLK